MSLFSTGSINTLSALWQLGKITVDRANGGTGFFSKGYRPKEWNVAGGVSDVITNGNIGDVTNLLGTDFSLGSLIGSYISGDFNFDVTKIGGSNSELVLVKTNIGGFFFDAVLNEQHDSELTITQHPVQTGANIADHSFLNPSTLTMEIGMSDAMATMLEGQFTEYYTKSVSAYEKLRELQALRLPVSVHTRLYHYDNMLVQNITAPDSYRTQYGLRCTVTLQEIFVVNVATGTVSTRNWASSRTTNRGEVQPQATEQAGSALYEMGA